MNAEGHKVAQLTGALQGAERDVIIDDFRHGRAKVLIATNVLARGIDVQTVSLVVNYVSSMSIMIRLLDAYLKKDLPLDARGQVDPETYLHRIGRTGRFGRVGVSISLIHNRRSWDQLMEIGNFFGTQSIGLDINDWDSVEATIKQVIKSTRAGANFNPKS